TPSRCQRTASSRSKGARRANKPRWWFSSWLIRLVMKVVLPARLRPVTPTFTCGLPRLVACWRTCSSHCGGFIAAMQALPRWFMVYGQYRTTRTGKNSMAYADTHSKAVGYLLWIFGFMGAHRFYYGKPWTGTLYFFTLGLFFI